MHRALIGIALASATLAPPAPVATHGSIDEFIRAAMPESGAPGLAYVVIDDGEIAAEGSYGVVRSGSQEEVSTHTPFLIGSISKSFTAFAAMQLVEEGRLRLDNPLSAYLTQFRDAPLGSVTIRQLLSHTSGLSTLQGNQSHSDTSGAEDELERAVDSLVSITPDHAPGEGLEMFRGRVQRQRRLHDEPQIGYLREPVYDLVRSLSTRPSCGQNAHFRQKTPA